MSLQSTHSKAANARSLELHSVKDNQADFHEMGSGRFFFVINFKVSLDYAGQALNFELQVFTD